MDRRIDDDDYDSTQYYQSLSDDDLQKLAGEMVQVGAYGWIEEAKQAEGLLRSVSIPCYLKNENVLRIDPRVWMLGPGGLCLMVAASDAEQARAILNTRVSDEDLAAQAEAAKPPDPRQ